MTSQAEKIFEYDQYAPLSTEKIKDSFFEFIFEHSEKIKQLIVNQKTKTKNLQKYSMRIGFVYPRHVIISEKVKELCRLSYERYDGRIAPCSGITENRKGCPPYSPKVNNTIKLLNKSTVFLIIQFENIEDRANQKYIQNFTVKIEKILMKNKYNVLNTYCTGPCRVCADGCPEGNECRFPAIRRFALESCGFWVNKICDQASLKTIYGDTDWKIKWIKNYGFPNQTPKRFKTVSGILLK